VEGVDENTVYFTANQGDFLRKNLFSVKLDGSDFQRVSKEDGWHSATFSDDAKHWLDRYSSAIRPPQWSMCSGSATCSKFWESRSVPDLIAPKFLNFKAEDGTTLYGELLLPPETTSGKIPIVVYVYGGPASQIVRDEWQGTTPLFHELLARKGFAVFSVDNRGTPNRGRAFSASIRKQYGPIELKDQLAALNQLVTQYPQLDKDRVAVWGWSGGGSLTLYSMTHSEAYKAGVAVAPVTDQRNYDTIYTERYMGLPKDNAKGYDEGAMTKAASQLHGSLFLVHGTSDDNVHFQNSVQMVDALVKAGKPFRLMIYPNKTHGIAGSAARTHLFHLIQEHFEHELN
jgi:dipeptidyl-peptidase-4